MESEFNEQLRLKNEAINELRKGRTTEKGLPAFTDRGVLDPLPSHLRRRRWGRHTKFRDDRWNSVAHSVHIMCAMYSRPP